MNNLNTITDNVIDRIKNLKKFVVERNIEDIPFNGVFKYTVSHRLGELAQITVFALTQEEAEKQVDDWLNEQTA